MKKAKKIWKEIFNELYGRGGFDDWWDGIDKDVKAEIDMEVILAINNKLKKWELE